MKKIIFFVLKTIRASVFRFVRSKDRHALFGGSDRWLIPVSSKFGFDRGLPIDRFYVEGFLNKNRELIKGRCLEVVDNAYTVKFGGTRVIQSDIVDNNPKNKNATICGDLRDLSGVADNIFDTLIITQTFGMIDDLESAVKECRRILKPGGALLVTATTVGPLWEKIYWRLMPASVQYLFGKYFKNIHIETFGNVFIQQCFLSGFAAEELASEELSFNDSRFPLVIGLRVIK